MNPYDEVPYEGHAVPLAHPERMAVAAMRSGLAPREPARASVLELGCAEGGNILPIAYHLTEAQFLGVDGSAVHIEAATAARDRLGLDNLTLRHADFLALADEDLGEHDYIIVHGVLSWVDEGVRGALLELVRRHLAPQGVAYISYNCAAGWALKNELRALLLRHTAPLVPAAAKVSAARALLAQLAASPLREASLHAAALAERAEAVLSQRDAYLLHEYLAPVNYAFRQPELRALMADHGLAFVRELASATSRADLEDNLQLALFEKQDDPAEVAELADVMLGRAFRASLFCRADAERRPIEEAERALAAQAVFRGALHPEGKRPSLDAGVTESFVAGSGAKIAIRSPLLKAAVLELARAWPRGLALAPLLERAALLLELRRVANVDAHSDESRDGLADDLLELVRLEQLELRLSEPSFAVEAAPMPRVEALTRYEAERSSALTTPHHIVLGLDPFARILVRYLDGSRARSELVRRMTEHADRGEVTLSDESGQPLPDPKRAETIDELVHRTIETLRTHGLLTV